MRGRADFADRDADPTAVDALPRLRQRVRLRVKAACSRHLVNSPSRSHRMGRHHLVTSRYPSRAHARRLLFEFFANYLRHSRFPPPLGGVINSSLSPAAESGALRSSVGSYSLLLRTYVRLPSPVHIWACLLPLHAALVYIDISKSSAATRFLGSSGESLFCYIFVVVLAGRVACSPQPVINRLLLSRVL